MSKIFEAHARVKGTDDWAPVTYRGERCYFDEDGIDELRQMTTMMASVFAQNEYKLVAHALE